MTYTSAPLPFVGQKRNFVREYIKVLDLYPDSTVFVDLFGGSGLLSHVAKRRKPMATVVYNDFDNYHRRIDNIPRTNVLLARIRDVVQESNTGRGKRLNDETKRRVIESIREEEMTTGYVDYITISASILFSMHYKLSLEELAKESLYNKVRLSDYPMADDYLEGLIVESCDYRELFERYKDTPEVVFLVDPPYLSTEVGTYSTYWRLTDYLDVLTVLAGYEFVYFTSDKSSIVELCEWMGQHKDIGNPFELCHRVTFNARMNHTASYTDMMLYTAK